MTQASAPLSSQGSDAVAGVRALTENADRLGLIWKLRPGSVIAGGDPTATSVLMDGDVQPVNCISLIGVLQPGMRVMCEIVPPSGIYVVGYSGQQVVDTSRLYSGFAGGTNFTTTSYADLPGAVISDFAKAAPHTGLRVDLRASGFAATALALYACQGGVNILGTDYDVNWFFFNTASVHATWSAKGELSGIPAGTFDIQARFRASVAAKTVTMDANDLITLEATEIA